MINKLYILDALSLSTVLKTVNDNQTNMPNLVFCHFYTYVPPHSQGSSSTTGENLRPQTCAHQSTRSQTSGISEHE